MRGISIGHIKAIQLNINSVTALIYIYSKNILIPKHSIIEINQVGLFNNSIIDITPLDSFQVINNFNVFTSLCFKSKFLCNNDYVKGYRGLNYDDLIRAATRISQRFDDPRFFQLLYLFLQNIIDISDEIVLMINHVSYIISLLIDFIEIYLVKYII
uniref:Mce/MlaD domain-containing protein n=1 Tax=Pleonosporium borreri TaxID=2575635 RepID=A0A4D6WYY2_9FLOR|nr:hypothetical protein [Pleonosporium borreri]